MTSVCLGFLICRIGVISTHTYIRGISEAGMSKASTVPGGKWTLCKCELESRAV